MTITRQAVALVSLAVLAGCGGGPGAEAPTDASIDDFCAAKEWLVTEGMARFSAAGGPPSKDGLVDLIRDWSQEFIRVGTPENISADARAGFEKFVERADGLEEGDVDSGMFNWASGSWEGDEEKAFAAYMTNTCGVR